MTLTEETATKRPAEDVKEEPELKKPKVDNSEASADQSPTTSTEVQKTQEDVDMKKASEEVKSTETEAPKQEEAKKTTEPAPQQKPQFGNKRRGQMAVTGPITDGDIKTQVEYYLSVKNLSQDSFFHPMMKAEGALCASALLACNKLRQMVEIAEKDTELKGWAIVVNACKDSSELDFADGPEGEKTKISRKDKQLPDFVGRGGKNNQTPLLTAESSHEVSMENARGGVILRVEFEKLESEVQWGDVKASMRAYLEANKASLVQKDSKSKAEIYHCTTKFKEEKGKIGILSTADAETDVEAVYLVISPFPGDLAHFRKQQATPLEVTVRDKSSCDAKESSSDAPKKHSLHFTLLDDEKAFNNVYNNCLNMRVKEWRKQNVLRSSKMAPEKREVCLPSVDDKQMKFDNLACLKKRVIKIISDRSDGEKLTREGGDFKLMNLLLDIHPRGAEKKKNMVDIEVGTSSFEGSRCLFVVKADGTKEDFSCVKIYREMEEHAKKYFKGGQPGGKGKGKGKGKK